MAVRTSAKLRVLTFCLAISAVVSGGFLRAAERTASTATHSFVATAQEGDGRKKFTKQQIVERLKYSTCWINCPGGSSGTGWVLDKDRRLIVTNQHVIRRAKSINVYFPEKRGGEWVNDVKHYLRFVKPITGTVIESNSTHDLALVQLSSLPKTAQVLELARKSPPQGSQLHSIGARTLGSDTMWSYTIGHVRQVGQGTNSNGGTSRIVEAQMEYNKGNSGGAIVDDYGEVVAVVEGYRSRSRNGGELVAVRNVSIAVDIQQVRSWLRDALPLVTPTTARQFLTRGTRHYEEGRYDQAIRDLSDSIRRDTRSAKAYTMRGWAFYRKRDYRTALGDFNDALKLDSNHADAHYGHGMVNRAMKKTADAIKDFTNAIRINPAEYRYYNQRGIIYYRDKKYREAYDDFTRAINNEKNKYILFENKGMAALGLRYYNTAAAAFREANRLNPRNSANHNYEGICYFRLKDYKKASAKFLDAIKVNSKRALYHENLGSSLQYLNNHKSAIIAYTRAMSVSKTTTASQYFNRGYSKYKLQNYVDAIKDFTEAIKKDSKNANAYYYRGKCYKARGLNFSASSDFRKAKALDPKKFGNLR